MHEEMIKIATLGDIIREQILRKKKEQQALKALNRKQIKTFMCFHFNM